MMSNQSNKRIECVVEGRVQGVGYRASVARSASELPITGWIKNQLDDTVKCVAEGDEAVLRTLINILYDGSAVSHVDKIHIDWLEPTGELTSFQIRY